jgi:chromatin modification-related protein EAF6
MCGRQKAIGRSRECDAYLDMTLTMLFVLQDSPGPSSAQTTPSHAATPISTPGGNMSMKGGLDPLSVSLSTNGMKSSNGSSKNKKKAGGGSKNTKGKNTEDVSDDDKPSVKRLKISYGRD